MISHLLIILFVIFIYEMIIYFDFVQILKLNIKTLRKLIGLIKFRNSSDLRKEKLILNYSRTLFLTSLKILITILFILFLILILDIFFVSFLESILSLFGTIEIIFTIIIYNKLRKKKINAKL